MSTQYITPTGAGRRDGSSWENAATLSSINTLIVKAGPGGEVLVRADLGTYNLRGPIEITRGGTEAGDVTIRGVDGAGKDMLAHFDGTRMEVYTPGGNPGFDGIRLLTGADHLAIKNFKLEDMGRAIHVGSSIKDLEISNIVGENVMRLFDNDYRSGTDRKATITGLVIEDVEVHGFSKGVIRLNYDTNGVIIRNVYGDSERQDKDNFAMGVHLTGTVHDVLIENSTMRNSHSSLGNYWNGDGFVTEKNVHGIRFVNTVATGSTDAGYDLKSTDTVLIGAYAADNKRNYRIWSDGVTIIDSVSEDVNGRGGIGAASHFWLAEGASTSLVNVQVYERNPKIVFDLEGRGTKLALDDVDVYAASDARLSRIDTGSSITTSDGLPVKSLPLSSDMTSTKPMIVLSAPEPTIISVAATQAAIGEGQFGQTDMSFTVTRSGPSDLQSVVAWTVAVSGPDAASAADFVGDKLPGGVVTLAPGQTSVTVSIAVKADRLVEADEAFNVTLNSPVNGQIGKGIAQMVILNDDPMPTGITTLGKDSAVDLSGSGNKVALGRAHHEAFFVDSAASSGRDTIKGFGTDDVLLTTRALFDSNNDGLIGFSRNTVSIDRQGGTDTITFGDKGLAGLRWLGLSDGGLNVYADASVRPAIAVEGTLSDDSLRGDAGDKRTDRFFFDTALDLDLGSDQIDNFGSRDMIVTTTRLSDVSGKVTLSPGGILDLPGGAGALHDGYFAGEGGQVKLFGATGAPLQQLEYDGAVTRKGMTYHVYTAAGSSTGLADF